MRIKISGISVANESFLQNDLGYAGLSSFGEYESDTVYITGRFNALHKENDDELSLADTLKALLRSGFKVELLR